MKQKMYLGPTVPGLIKENVIYKDVLPKAVEERAQEDKSFARLLVPMGKVMEAKKQLETEGSVLAVSYENVAKSL